MSDPEKRAADRASFNADIVAHLTLLQLADQRCYDEITAEKQTSASIATRLRLSRILDARQREIDRLITERKRREQHGLTPLQRELMALEGPRATRPERRPGPGRPRGSKNKVKQESST